MTEFKPGDEVLVYMHDGSYASALVTRVIDGVIAARTSDGQLRVFAETHLRSCRFQLLAHRNPALNGDDKPEDRP